MNGGKLPLFCVHGPRSGKHYDDRQEFYAKLAEADAGIPGRQRALFLRDFKPDSIRSAPAKRPTLENAYSEHRWRNTATFPNRNLLME